MMTSPATLRAARTLRAATRGSRLSLWQTEHIAKLLNVKLEPVIITTTGDRRWNTPIHEMGGKGVFVKEVQSAVLEGHADIAVHSTKDLPSVLTPGLTIAAIPERGDPRDALVGCQLADLPQNATIATGSVRRKTQLAWLRPDIVFSELRGNIGSRLKKAVNFHGIVVAVAALERLRLTPEVLDILPVDVMLPQAGQGSIAVECRADDTDTYELLQTIEHEPSRQAVDAERAFLAELGGDCNLPAGAHAILTTRTPPNVRNHTLHDAHHHTHQGDMQHCAHTTPQDNISTAAVPNHIITLTGMLASIDGKWMLQDTQQGVKPHNVGITLAQKLIENANDTAATHQHATPHDTQHTAATHHSVRHTITQ